MALSFKKKKLMTPKLHNVTCNNTSGLCGFFFRLWLNKGRGSIPRGSAPAVYSGIVAADQTVRLLLSTVARYIGLYSLEGNANSNFMGKIINWYYGT